MNKLLVHFLLSNLKRQITDKIGKKYGDTYGEILAVSYLGEGNRIIQRVNFTNKQIDAELDENDKAMFKKIPGVNLDKELNSCASIIAQFNFQHNKIRVTHYYKDGTEKTTNF